MSGNSPLEYGVNAHMPITDTIVVTFTGEVLGFENLVFSIFEFVHTLLENNKFKTTVKKALPELIYYIILYMQITEDQVSDGLRSVSSSPARSHVLTGVETLATFLFVLRSKRGPPTPSSLWRTRTTTRSRTPSGSLHRTCCW